MRLVVDAHKMIKGDVRVALGGGKAGMAEQFLHGAHIRAVLQHVRGEGVTQGVRRQMLRQSGAFADLVENPRRLPPVEPLASVAHEKGFFGGRGDERAHPEPEEQRPDGRVAQRRDTFLGTLAYDPDETACRVHIVHIQIESFGNTQPGTVEQFRQRQIAGVPGVLAVRNRLLGLPGTIKARRAAGLHAGLVQQGEHLIHVQRRGVAEFPLGVTHELCRVLVDFLHLHEIPEQRAQGRKLAANGTAGLAFMKKMRGIVLKVVFFQLSGPGERVLLTVEPLLELEEIRAVRRDRGRRKSFLIGHPRQELFHILRKRGHCGGGGGHRRFLIMVNGGPAIRSTRSGDRGAGGSGPVLRG